MSLYLSLALMVLAYLCGGLFSYFFYTRQHALCALCAGIGIVDTAVMLWLI